MPIVVSISDNHHSGHNLLVAWLRETKAVGSSKHIMPAKLEKRGGGISCIFPAYEKAEVLLARNLSCLVSILVWGS